MSKARYLIVLILFVMHYAQAEAYRCLGADGEVGFSDKPCVKGQATEVVHLPDELPAWVAQLKNQKPTSIKIIDVVKNDGDININYEFGSAADASAFMRLTSTLSKQNVTLLKVSPPTGEMRVSSKSSPLFSKIINDNKSKKAEANKDFSKCIPEIASHEGNFSYEEACEVRKSCPEGKAGEPVRMYCTLVNIDQCNTSRSWQTIQELVGLPHSTQVQTVSKQVSVVNGVKTTKTCALYN